MPAFSISYDLVKRKDYPELWTELKRLGARRVLLSQWGVRLAPNTTAASLRDNLMRYIDADDRLVIIQIDGTDWATYNALYPLAELKKVG
jgi:hypothetical protein